MDDDSLPCACGQRHTFPTAVYLLIKEMNATGGPTISVQVPGAIVHVPRVWIAAHGIKAQELISVAKQQHFDFTRTGVAQN